MNAGMTRVIMSLMGSLKCPWRRDSVASASAPLSPTAILSPYTSSICYLRSDQL